jgi:predicted dehydrogenase
MKIAILGYGAIARRHLDILIDIIGRESLDVLVCRERSLPLKPEHAWARVTANFGEAVDFAPECAIVASPATKHVEQAAKLAALGTHLLVEKPLSADLPGTDELIRICEAKEIAVLVGYDMNYLPTMRYLSDAVASGAAGRVISMSSEVGQFLPDWRPGVDYRHTVSAKSSLGGGVLLELSHEIEYADRLLGGAKSVFCNCSVSGLLDIDAEDSADIIMEGANGATAAIHLDMLQKVPSRSCRVAGTDGALRADFIEGAVFIRTAKDRAERRCFGDSPQSPNHAYIEQMSHFLACAKGEAEPLVSCRRGVRVVELAVAAKRSAESGVKIIV